MPVTVRTIQEKVSRSEPIVCVTAYDEPSARLADAAGIDLILVGDSLGNVIAGHATTVPVTLEQMAYHTNIVARSCRNALVVADLPFGSYGGSVQQGFDSAVTLMKAGAHAVKLEGVHCSTIEACVQAGIPVMGHVGFTPQSVHKFGGFKVQGKGDDGPMVLEAALAIQESGCFAVVLELVPAALSREITEHLHIGTIGIGAGPHCNGQVQVFHDLLGFSSHRFKHAKRYCEAAELLQASLAEYAKEVRNHQFPTSEHSS